MNIFCDEFSTGQVVSSTGVSNPTLQSWLKRGMIVDHPENPISGGGSPGAHRRFSFFNVMEIAVAKSLIDVGLGELSSAFNAARSFAHAGMGSIGDEPFRDPSLPFHSKVKRYSTLLFVAGPRSIELAWSPGEDPIPFIQQSLGRDTRGFVVLHVDPIVEAVVEKLGYDFQQVLDLAYGSN